MLSHSRRQRGTDDVSANSFATNHHHDSMVTILVLSMALGPFFHLSGNGGGRRQEDGRKLESGC